MRARNAIYISDFFNVYVLSFVVPSESDTLFWPL